MFSTSMFIYDAYLLGAIVIFLLFKLMTINFDYWSKRGVPYVKPLPFFGNIFEAAIFKVDMGACLRNIYNSRNEPFFGIFIYNKPQIVVKDPELVKAVLIKDFNYFSDRNIAADENADSIAANMLFICKNPKWKTMRQGMTPMFTCNKLKNMMPLLKEAAENMDEYILTKCVNKSSIECKELCAKFTTDVLVSTIFGINSNCFKKEDSEFRVVGRNMFDFNLRRGFRSFCYFFAPSIVSTFKLKFFDEEVNTFLRKVLWETIEHRESANYSRNDFIDVLVQMKKENSPKTKLEIDRLLAQAVQLFAAGFETTSSTIAFTLYELSLHQNIQQKLQQEIDNALKQSKGELTYEAVQSMNYLDMVISETLRKYPVLPFLDRTCVQDYKLPNSNITLKKGTGIFIPMLGFHMDEKYFPNPDAYDPERFSEENLKSIPAGAYVPFGLGPHNCIGARFGLLVSKYGLISALSKFNFIKNELTPNPVKFQPKSFILQSLVGLPMKIEKRQNVY